MSHKDTRFILRNKQGETLDITDLLHVGGRCTCHDIEGEEDPPPCEYCRTHCLFCGAGKEGHPITHQDLAVLGLEGETPHDFEPMKKARDG